MRPSPSRKIRDSFDVDDIEAREKMEASENAGRSRPGRGGPALHRIDPDRVAQSLAADGNADGYARLHVMVNTVFDRLVADPIRSAVSQIPRAAAGRSAPTHARVRP
jgi:hypothetical protein